MAREQSLFAPFIKRHTEALEMLWRLATGVSDSSSTVMFSLFGTKRFSRNTDIPISSSKPIGMQQNSWSNHTKK